MLGALVTIAVLSPALAGGAALWLARSSREAGVLTLAADALAIAVWLALLAAPAQVATVWEWAPGLGFAVSWRVHPDRLAFALLVNGIGAVVQQYAVSHFAARPRAPRTLAGLAAFQSAMTGLVLADDLLLLYLFWEMTAICSFGLILADAERRREAYPAALKALLVTTAGGLCLFVAVLVLGGAAGTTSLARLLETELPDRTRTLALALVLPAVLTKSAQFPFHGWLPAAMVAPAPVSALLHSATMVKAGVILLVLVHPLFGDLPLWHVLAPVGAVTCVLGSWRALGTQDAKRLLAWSTVSQLGLLVAVLGVGTDAAVAAATLHLFAHALFKAGLFLAAGILDHAAGTRRLGDLGGLWRRMPATFAAVALLGASMAGLPPLLGFHSKELVFGELLEGGGLARTVARVGVLIGSVGTVAYTARLVLGGFLGRPRSEATRRAQDPPASLLAGPWILATLGVVAWSVPDALARGLAAMAPPPLGREVHLALAPSATPALRASLVVVVLGALAWALLRGRLLPHASLEILHRSLRGLARIGAHTDLLFAGLRPTTYFGAIVLIGLVPALWLLPEAFGGLSLDLTEPVLWLVAMQAVVLAALFREVGQLSVVLMVTAVGFTVALMFRAMQAPDLALTQLLVDMLTSVLLILAIRLLGHTERPADIGRATPAMLLVSGICGLSAFALTSVQLAEPTPRAVRDYYLEEGARMADGRNVVNVVLTDVRALDTLGETLVIAVAAVGVAGLLRGREMPHTQKSLDPGAPP